MIIYFVKEKYMIIYFVKEKLFILLRKNALITN